jgi:hypothetical protein
MTAVYVLVYVYQFILKDLNDHSRHDLSIEFICNNVCIKRNIVKNWG